MTLHSFPVANKNAFCNFAFPCHTLRGNDLLSATVLKTAAVPLCIIVDSIIFWFDEGLTLDTAVCQFSKFAMSVKFTFLKKTVLPFSTSSR